MSRLSPLEIESLSPEMQKIVAQVTTDMGFTPNDMLIMARDPLLVGALGQLVNAIYKPGALSIELKKMIALMSSSAAGCQYCQAHNTHGALETGIAAEKLESIWSYPDSELFSAAERVALDVARAASISPNEVTDEMFELLREHFNEEQIIELVAVVSLFGFLNRWNSTFKTEIEAVPAASALNAP